MNQLTKEQALQNLIVGLSQSKFTLDEADIIKQSIYLIQSLLKELDDSPVQKLAKDLETLKKGE